MELICTMSLAYGIFRYLINFMSKIHFGFYETITNNETLEHSLTARIEILRITQIPGTREYLTACCTKSSYVMSKAGKWGLGWTK